MTLHDHSAHPPELRRPMESVPRDSRGRFTRLVCVNAHDLCYGGAGGPCPYCEPKEQRK